MLKQIINKFDYNINLTIKKDIQHLQLKDM